MTKNLLPLLCLAGALTFCTPMVAQENATPSTDEWILDFEDNFDGPELDTRVWTKIPRGSDHIDWINTQSDFDDRCFEFRNGTLVLKGILNEPAVGDNTKYHTGGIWTKNKKAFAPGKFEARVRMKNCKGAWPAVWLMPFKQEQEWPAEGEVDIMETLNFDPFAYQTVHSKYTQRNPENPPHSKTGPINVNDWNVFGAEIHKDRVVFFINGKQTHEYKKSETAGDEQFPFYRDQEILIDQQLGGSWVGEVELAGGIAEMEVDWVRHYIKKTTE